MMNINNPFLTVLGGSLLLVVAGCDDSKPTIDKEGPQPPPSNEGVDSAQVMPEEKPATTEVVQVATPDFDGVSLPGATAHGWMPTPGGSWYATVTPGMGPEVMAETNNVTVSISLWRADGTTAVPGIESVEDLVVPMGDDMFPGWNESITGMRVGEVRKVAIPYEQTIGGDGRGLFRCDDGSDDEQMLVADVELVAIDAGDPTAASSAGS